MASLWELLTADSAGKVLQNKGQETINEVNALKLQQQKQDAEIEKRRQTAAPFLKESEVYQQSDDIEKAVGSLSKVLKTAIPGMGDINITKNEQGMEVIEIPNASGPPDVVPYNHDAVTQIRNRAKQLIDPKTYSDTYFTAASELEKTNKELAGTVVELDNGVKAYQRKDDNGRVQFINADTNQPIKGNPDTLQQMWAKKMQQQTYDKGKADITETNASAYQKTQSGKLSGEQAKWVGPTAQANIRQSDASAESSRATAAHTRKVTASGGKDTDPYDAKFSDALNKGYGLQVNAVDDDGKPVVYSDDTITEAQKWAAGKGYILRATKTKKGYALRGYEKIQEGTEAPIIDENNNQVPGVYRNGEWVPMENKAQPVQVEGNKQTPAPSKQPVLTGRKVTNYASALADESSDKPALRAEILKTYGQGALNRVDREAKRLAKERAQKIADSKKPLLKGTSAAGVKISIPNIFRGGN